MKNAGKGLGAGVLALIAILGLIVVSAGVYVFAANVGGEADKAANPGREKSVLFDPNNSIGRYEEFYDKCRSVVALDAKIGFAQEEVKSREKFYDPKADTFGEERKALARLRESLRGLRNQQVSAAEEYNADSSKTTRAQFKAADLPYTIDAPYSEVECGNPREAGR